MLLATRRIKDTRGEAFNIGGGPDRSVSLRELCGLLEDLTDRPMDLRFDEWRTSDQRYYVSDLGKLKRTLGWQPRVGVRDGVAQLLSWLTRRDGIEPSQRAMPIRVATVTNTPGVATAGRA